MTNYEEFKAIADDIAEMYANGYAEYAEYFSETFSGIGELSSITRMSDKLYALRHTDVKDPWYVDNLKGIAIDAILAIGEINVIPVKKEKPFLEVGARYWCKTSLLSDSLGIISMPLTCGCIYKYLGGSKFEDERSGTCSIVDIDNVELTAYLQKIIEKKS
jgi:hypothetical protein